MTIWETLAVAMGVSLDAFAIALVIGLPCPARSPQRICRVVIALTIPSLVLLLISLQLVDYAREFACSPPDWLAPLVLGGIGGGMIAGNSPEIRMDASSVSWWSLLLLGGLASLDVGAAGMALGKAGGTTWQATGLIPVLTGGLALCGLLLGTKLGQSTGRYAQLAGGLLLAGIAEYGCLF